MSTYQAFAYSCALALLTLALGFGTLWRETRDRLWLHFGLTCLAGGGVYLFDGYFLPVGEQPNLVATALGAITIPAVLRGLSRHLKLARRLAWGLLSLQVGLGAALVAMVAMVAWGALSRLGVFVGYALMFLSQLAVVWWGRDRQHWRRQVPVMIGLLMFPVIVAIFAKQGWDLVYLRYAVALAAFSFCLAMLAEGFLQINRINQAALAELGQARAQLEALVASMVEGASAVAQAGESVSRSAQQLAIQTDAQSASLQTISDTVHGVASQVRDTASNVVAVDQQCERLRDQAQQGHGVVVDAVAAIERINQRTQEMGEALALIESIAFQTNILSLNAAIEAARAGSAGRGFAVVATEVRALAQRTSESAQQIKALIERAGAQAGEGVDKMMSVRHQLDAMVDAVQDVAARTRAVSGDAQAQSQSLALVMASLDDLAQLIQTNAGLVAESVLASDGMNESANALRAMLASARLAPDPGAASVAQPAPMPAEQPIGLSGTPSVEFF